MKKQSKKQKENEFIYEQAEFITNTALKCEMNNLEKTAKIHNARRIKMCKLFLNIQTVFQLEKLNSIHLHGFGFCVLLFFVVCTVETF